jgi:hypothetical protein
VRRIFGFARRSAWRFARAHRLLFFILHGWQTPVNLLPSFSHFRVALS